MENVLRIYPNPSKNFITIQIPTFLKSSTLSIFSLTGTEILRQNIESEFTTINTQHLSSGMYIVVVGNENMNFEAKFLKVD